MTITKSDLIEAISVQFNLSSTEAKEQLETLLETMKSTLASGEDVMISGFGKFQVNDKATRKGRNPATGETMTLDSGWGYHKGSPGERLIQDPFIWD